MIKVDELMSLRHSPTKIYYLNPDNNIIVEYITSPRDAITRGLIAGDTDEYYRQGSFQTELSNLFLHKEDAERRQRERDREKSTQRLISLLQTAEVDKHGNLYYVDKSIGINNRVYFATVTTICDDFVKEYCYESEDGFEHYNRHFSPNDDTLEIKILNLKGR